MSNLDPTLPPRHDAIPVAPSLGAAARREHVSVAGGPPAIDRRVVVLCGMTIVLGVVAAFVAQALVHLIAFVTHLAFEGRFSFALEGARPTLAHVGAWVILLPVIGGLIVGAMARYGSKAIRGHGIPEAMEQVLTNESRIPARVTLLKPLSSAIAIGTGGPFGAEGPIIATGGALGSVLGQLLHTTAQERKTLLAAGAAAGMAATFGAPVSATLLAVELLLFEFRPRSLVPVALAAVTASTLRAAFEGTAPVFAMPTPLPPSVPAMAVYLAIGAIMGVIAAVVTKAVYAIEDAFEHLPIPWPLWPAIGGIAVGVVGYFDPRTLGVGYQNISDVLGANLPLAAIASLCVLKFVSWSIALGSGTSGGTLAPLFTIGGACGALLGAAAQHVFPHSGIEVGMAALVGMAAIFAGASHALLAAAVFAFETTLQPLGLPPLLGGCAASFLVSSLLLRHSIMTEKIARRGVHVPRDYQSDALAGVRVADVMTRAVLTLPADATIEAASRSVLASSHDAFPVVRADGTFVGVVRRRNFAEGAAPDRAVAALASAEAHVTTAGASLREAVDALALHDVAMLAVLDDAGRVVGVLSRGDALRAHGGIIRKRRTAGRHVRLGRAASATS